MAGFVPLGDASRPPTRFAAVTILIILLNVWVFFQELTYGDPYVWTWSAVPIRIIHGQRLVTLLDIHVYARQLDAHHRQHGLPVGLRPRN